MEVRHGNVSLNTFTDGGIRLPAEVDGQSGPDHVQHSARLPAPHPERPHTAHHYWGTDRRTVPRRTEAGLAEQADHEGEMSTTNTH